MKSSSEVLIIASDKNICFKLNIASSSTCVFNEEQGFVEIKTAESPHYGMYFKENQEAPKFVSIVEQMKSRLVILESRLQSQPLPQPPLQPLEEMERNKSVPPSSTLLPAAGGAAVTSEETSKSKGIMHKIGKVLSKTFSSVMVFKDAEAVECSPSVIEFQSAQHEGRIIFDPILCRYVGQPESWSNTINKQFGIDFIHLPRVDVEGYKEKIPAVLEMLKRLLIENNGLQSEGIFRLAPDKGKCAEVMDRINTGCFEDCTDVNIIANLIKVFFRELPTCLLKNVPERIIHKVAEGTSADAAVELENIPEPTRTIIVWLLDLMAAVVSNEAVNKMGVKNMAICMSPNLLAPNVENPMAAMTKAQMIASFTTKLLNFRMGR